MFSTIGDWDDICLKCSTCSYPLSISPIFYHETLGSICGRCKNIAVSSGRDKFHRQIMFEEMMKNIIFPCAFKKEGCLAEIHGKDAYIHEQGCLFRVKSVLCPLFREKFFDLCTWIGDHQKLSDHIRKMHRKNFHENSKFTISPDIINKVIFFESDSKIMMAIIKKSIESDSFICKVMCDMNMKDQMELAFNISLSVEDGEKLMFTGKKLEFFSPIFNTSECEVKIPISTLNNLFQKCDKITVSIVILPNEKLEQSSKFMFSKEKPKPSEEAEVTTLILNKLKCQICTKIMGPPIYLCTEGHNLCEYCRNDLQECPICKGNISGLRISIALCSLAEPKKIKM